MTLEMSNFQKKVVRSHEVIRGHKFEIKVRIST